MSRDGPPPSRLSERMAERIESEKRLIEEHQATIATMLENARLEFEKSLKAEFEHVRTAMQTSTAEATTEIRSFSTSWKVAIAELKGTIAQHSIAGLKDYQASIARFNTNAIRSFRELLKGARLTLIFCGALFLSTAAILFAMTWWTRLDLSATKDQIASERKALADIQAMTGQVKILKASGETYVVLPMETDTRKVFGCDGRPCLKLPGR